MLPTQKKELRQALLKRRLEIPEKERAALDRALSSRIAAHPYFQKATAILGYSPMRAEPNLMPLFESALAQGKAVFFPRCVENGMQFYRFHSCEELTPDRYGIPSPPTENEVLKQTANALCIVPGLAADRQGARLGYGGGFYDRFLPSFEGHVLFALYERFVLDTLPCDAHDFKISTLITEKEEVRYV